MDELVAPSFDDADLSLFLEQTGGPLPAFHIPAALDPFATQSSGHDASFLEFEQALSNAPMILDESLMHALNPEDPSSSDLSHPASPLSDEMVLAHRFPMSTQHYMPLVELPGPTSSFPTVVDIPKVFTPARPAASPSSKKQKKRKRSRSPSASPAVAIKVEPGSFAAADDEFTIDDSDLPADTPLTLNELALSKLTSKQLDQYSARLTAARDVTPDEDKMLKRQRRLIKNRESAMLSRMRKKAYMGTLEAKLEVVSSERDQFAARVRELEAENMVLNNEIRRLSTLLGTAPPSSFSSMDFSGVSFANHGSDERPAKQQRTSHSRSHRKQAAGVALLLVMFTFGIMFNGPEVVSDLGSPGRVVELDSGHHGASRVLNEFNSSPALDDREAALALHKTPEVVIPMTIRREPASPPRTTAGLGPVTIVDVSHLDSSRPLKRQRVDDGSAPLALPGSVSQRAETQRPILEVDPNATAGEFMSAVQRYVGSSQTTKVDQSYVYCPEAQALSPLPRLDGSNPDPMIAVLLPSSVLGASVEGLVHPSLLQVQCQVMDYYTWPVRQPAVAAPEGTANQTAELTH